MKLNINEIIEETMSNEIRNRILLEQEENSNLFDKIKLFKSLTPFLNQIMNVVRSTDYDENGIIIHITDLTIEDLLNHTNAGTIDEALRNITKNLHNDAKKNGMGDIDLGFDISGESKESLDLQIKITANKELGSEINENMKKSQLIESANEFAECLTKAKQNNEETFDYNGNKFNVQEVINEFEEDIPCDECDQEIEEVETAESELAGSTGSDEIYTTNNITYESEKQKRTIRLSETKFKEMINRMVSEALKPKVVGNDPKVNTITKPYKDATKAEKNPPETLTQKDTPGLQAVKNAHKEGESDEKEHFNEVDKKLDDYLKFEGNDNPEFPGQIGTGEIVATRDAELGEEAQDYVDTYRGMGSQDAAYDVEPSQSFKDRVKKALIGDPTMGNDAGEDTANAIKTDVGDKVLKNIDKKRDSIDKDPMYVKDEQPVADDKDYKKDQHDPGFETIDGKKDKKDSKKDKKDDKKVDKKVVSEEIERMKNLLSYNEKTQ